MRTQVAIVGSGPAGLLLGHLLTGLGIDNVIVERASRPHVLSRIRAGVLEEGSVNLLRDATRVLRDGLVHTGIEVAFDGRRHRIDLRKRSGRSVTVYGQTEVTRDLMDVREVSGAPSFFECADVTPTGYDTGAPLVQFAHAGAPVELEADFIAGCDGFHGVCRASIAPGRIALHEHAYGIGWLGLLADVPPVAAANCSETAWV